MESPEQLLRGIESPEELRSIVKTMRSLSAPSIRQYESAATVLAECYRTVELGPQVVLDPRPAATGQDATVPPPWPS